MENSKWPDFIVIGAGKSGTTALNEYLRQHPEIYMSKRKEPNFFALESIDINNYEIEESRAYHLASIYKKQDYLDLFSDANEEICGEISNLYLNSEYAAQNIKKHVPDVKLIAILRHPSERLYSRYLHLLRENELPEEGLSNLFDRDSIWWKRPDLIQEGFYYKNLTRFYNLFNSNQIRVYFYEDFKVSPMSVLMDIFRFIGVREDVYINTDITVNKSGKLKNNLFNKLLGQNGAIIHFSKEILPSAHSRLRNNIILQRCLNKWRNKNIEDIHFDTELRNRITEEIYENDIVKLGDLLNKDLSSWLQQKKMFR